MMKDPIMRIATLTLPGINAQGFFLHPSSLPLPIAGVAVEVRCPEAFCELNRSPPPLFPSAPRYSHTHTKQQTICPLGKNGAPVKQNKNVTQSLPLTLRVCQGVILTDLEKIGESNRPKVPRCPSLIIGRPIHPRLLKERGFLGRLL